MESRILRTGRFPVFTWQDRKTEKGRGEKRDVQDGLRARRETPVQGVGIRVAPEQRYLEEQEARSPHRGAAAEPRQADPGDLRLDLEE